ncbi:MAG: T9SS type A sorting domain-containing protein [Candidatus Marinimicrobia bacterium]|nr:T9SS type A sorting domain-containing protein [Candidatus Neomarinimicrobiota bacterium]MCF7839701.1 T9SS type A sorting domain-containing protein [Candidatus Neomarinimicrobiota bacterium]MCF7901929.1 T9SS type A sorting domain-containing protein [Candidatus Neomarinimicrobiota bacterium]
MKKLRVLPALLVVFTTLSYPVAVLAGSHADPAFIKVVSVETAPTVDGVLDENVWARRYDRLVFNAGMGTGDVDFAVTGGVEVQAPYTDTTSTIVKIVHDGLDLYISLDSDDKSVCRFNSSWEGDGMFMKIKDASGADMEYKLYFNLEGTDPDIHLEVPGLYPTSAEGAAYKKPGTIVNDTTSVDSGYTAELVIHLADLGYTDMYADIPVLINIFDPDGYTGVSGEAWTVGQFYKAWWGSEWGPDMRILRLSDPPTRVAFATEDEIVLDGQINEAFWAGAESVLVGHNTNGSTGGYYAQWSDSSNDYTDASETSIKFIHNGALLYIAVESNDMSVGKWSPGWEADGLFLWMTDKGDYAPAARKEIKAMYFTGVEGDGISFETNDQVPTGSAEGVSFEPTGTVTHSGTNGDDAGYSIEVVINTADFGYEVGDTVRLSTVIWDLDYSSADEYDAAIADYAPEWWGTQWADPNFEKYYMYRGVILSSDPVSATDFESVPASFELSQNYPNPFNAGTVISMSLPESGNANLEIYNVLGQNVATLYNGFLSAGSHNFSWNSLGNHNQQLSTGVYFYRLTVGDQVAIKKMVMVK